MKPIRCNGLVHPCGCGPRHSVVPLASSFPCRHRRQSYDLRDNRRIVVVRRRSASILIAFPLSWTQSAASMLSSPHQRNHAISKYGLGGCILPSQNSKTSRRTCRLISALKNVSTVFFSVEPELYAFRMSSPKLFTVKLTWTVLGWSVVHFVFCAYSTVSSSPAKWESSACADH